MGADAAEPLIGLLKEEKNLGVRVALVQALGNIGPAAKAAIPLIEPMTKTKNQFIRRAAQTALDQIRAEKK